MFTTLCVLFIILLLLSLHLCVLLYLFKTDLQNSHTLHVSGYYISYGSLLSVLFHETNQKCIFTCDMAAVCWIHFK